MDYLDEDLNENEKNRIKDLLLVGKTTKDFKENGTSPKIQKTVADNFDIFYYLVDSKQELVDMMAIDDVMRHFDELIPQIDVMRFAAGLTPEQLFNNFQLLSPYLSCKRKTDDPDKAKEYLRYSKKIQSLIAEWEPDDSGRVVEFIDMSWGYILDDYFFNMRVQHIVWDLLEHNRIRNAIRYGISRNLVNRLIEGFGFPDDIEPILNEFLAVFEQSDVKKLKEKSLGNTHRKLIVNYFLDYSAEYYTYHEAFAEFSELTNGRDYIEAAIRDSEFDDYCGVFETFRDDSEAVSAMSPIFVQRLLRYSKSSHKIEVNCPSTEAQAKFYEYLAEAAYSAPDNYYRFAVAIMHLEVLSPRVVEIAHKYDIKKIYEKLRAHGGYKSSVIDVLRKYF